MAEPIPVFGQPIDTLVKAQQARGNKSDIPSVITESILWLDAHQAIKTANIFRALGHAPTVQLIKNEFEAGTWNAANHKREDMHSIAAILKYYLRALPDSIVPSKYYSLALKIAREVVDPSQQAYEFRVLVYSFPKASRDTILYLSNFLHRVAHSHKDNGADARTLAHTFGPYFIRPPPTDPPSPDHMVIPTDAESAALVVQRFIEEAPFFFKTTSRPNAAPKDNPNPQPTTSSLVGRALYPYAGGGKWLIPLQKEDKPILLDIKNEEGWLKADLKGESGYVPLTYVQVIPAPPPSTDLPRGGIPLEYDVGPLEPVIPSQTPTLPRREDLPQGKPRSFTDSTHIMSPALGAPSPILSAKHHDSPALSHLPLSPPPPLTALPPLANNDLLPPPMDIANIPPPIAGDLPSPLSTSLPTELPAIFTVSPRGHSQSASYPNLPPPSLVTPTPLMPANKSSSFNLATSASSEKLNVSVGNEAHAQPVFPTKLTRTFSHSAPPPPRLIAPQLPVDKKDDGDETDRTDRTDRTDKTEESERHEDASDTSDDDFDASASEEVQTPAAAPPPPPPVPSTPISLEPNAADAEKEIANAKKRKERCEEVLSTERTYVKQLTVVYDCFVEPLKRRDREKSPILNATDIFAIFSNVEVILNCHRKLLDAFEKRMQVFDSTPELGDIFLENTAFIKLYKHYVNNFDKSIITLKSCREKNPEFQKFAQELDYTEKLSNLSVESFLILPVQRIPRYVLLLQDLLKFTTPVHRDFNNLTNALAFIKDLADYINSNKSDADNITKIATIQDALLDLPPDVNLVVPKRRFLEEGGLLYKKQKAWMYLFSDALLFTKVEKKGKRYKAIINLPTASLNTTDEPGVIKIISTEGTFKFSGETPKDKDHWVKVIREAMDESRVVMLNSAFGDSLQAEGSNKQFMKIKDEENAVKKRSLVDRLVNSEQEYVDSLTYLSKTFLAPLRKAVDSPMPMIALSELIDISSNLETLLNCHIGFLQSLKERVAEWNDKSYVNDLFSEKAAFLKLYNYYVSNHHKSLSMLDHCIEKYPLFAIFLRDLEAREKAELKVLLQEPLRRVSAYYLIVQEMIQYTKHRTEEHDLMAKVVARLKEQTEKLNADLHEHMGKNKTEKEKKLDRSKSSKKFRQ